MILRLLAFFSLFTFLTASNLFGHKTRVMLASCLEGEPEAIHSFLESIEHLRQETYQLEYYFIDQCQALALNDFAYHQHVELLETHVSSPKQTFLELAHEKDVDYLFIVNANLSLDPRTLEALLSEDKEIISSLYWIPQESGVPIPQVWLTDEMNFYERSKTTDLSWKAKNKIWWEFVNKIKVPGIYEVGGIQGIYLISRSAIKRGVSFAPLSNVSFDKEDTHFCLRAAALGIPLFVDTRYPTYLYGDIKNKEKKLMFNVLTSLNGRGLSADLAILEHALRNMGHKVRAIDIHGEKNLTIPYADVNLFIELFDLDLFSFAEKNWFIPNPEWYSQPLKNLDHFDLILCRTHEVERIFQNLGLPTYFLGFTSLDRFRGDVKKDFSRVGHFAGASFQKGTFPILNTWKAHDELPHLLLTSHYYGSFESPHLKINDQWIPDEDFSFMCNACGVHLCLSETEGFGHSIMEALSVGAVVVTVDAPPMNEFVQDSRCLIPYKDKAYKGLATNYYFNENFLPQTILQLKSLPEEELIKIGRRNRDHYLNKKQEFLENLSNLLKEIE